MMELEAFLNQASKLSYVDLIRICALTLILNNLLMFSIGAIVGYLGCEIIQQDIYEQKLIMRDFNITHTCIYNTTDGIKIAQYKEEALRMLATTGTIKEEMVCGPKNFSDKDNLAQ